MTKIAATGIQTLAYSDMLDAESASTATDGVSVEVEVLVRGEDGAEFVVVGLVRLGSSLVPRRGELLELSSDVCLRIDQVVHRAGAASRLWTSSLGGTPAMTAVAGVLRDLRRLH